MQHAHFINKLDVWGNRDVLSLTHYLILRFLFYSRTSAAEVNVWRLRDRGVKQNKGLWVLVIVSNLIVNQLQFQYGKSFIKIIANIYFPTDSELTVLC